MIICFYLQNCKLKVERTVQVVERMAAEEEGAPVDLYVYDLTHGLAALLSPAILGHILILLLLLYFI